MPGELPVQLRIFGGSSVIIGAASGPEDLPELLLHAAAYFDANPDKAAKLFKGQCRGSVAPKLAQPFSTPSTVW